MVPDIKNTSFPSVHQTLRVPHPFVFVLFSVSFRYQKSGTSYEIPMYIRDFGYHIYVVPMWYRKVVPEKYIVRDHTKNVRELLQRTSYNLYHNISHVVFVKYKFCIKQHTICERKSYTTLKFACKCKITNNDITYTTTPIPQS